MNNPSGGCGNTNARFRARLTVIASLAIISAGCGSGDNEEPSPPPTETALSCDAASIQKAFRTEDKTSIVEVRQVKKGEAFPNPALEQLLYPEIAPTFEADLCMVKLMVGPGNAGPVGAPSTTAGVGLEIWLPERSAWNKRLHAIGGSGSIGGDEGVAGKISSWSGTAATESAPKVAAREGAVTVVTDGGMGRDRSMSPFMNPDGSVNLVTWHDWTYRAQYEQSVRTKALIKAYYGEEPKYSYFDGASGGGRMGLHVAQSLAGHYNGIVIADPASQWMEMYANAYPTLVVLRDLGGVAPTRDQFRLVSSAAVASCDLVGGKHLGFVLDETQCRYDPTKDTAVLCATDGGTNSSAACVTKVQALAMNKMWYGPTRDGAVPDPAVDNGYDSKPGAYRKWYGIPRGSDLADYYSPVGNPYGPDAIALVLNDPRYGATRFQNALGQGQNLWHSFSYPQFADMFDEVRAHMQRWGASANNPDLGALKASGAKILLHAAVNDEALLSQGIVDYYDSVIERMGGLASVQSFFKMYLKPGLAHGLWNGSPNADAFPPVPKRGEFYEHMVKWVEQGVEPTNLTMTNASYIPSALAGFPGKPSVEISLPACAYPSKPTFSAGDSFNASSYTCR
jgi:hypothetical protein